MSSPGSQLHTRVGEVVESSSQVFTAQCYQLYQAPPLGTLVKTLSPDIYGVVSHISTGSLYSGRPVVARGEEEESEEDIYRSNPQLARLLCTRFDAAIAGYQTDGRVEQALPPLPPHIHGFVYQCEPGEIRSFAQHLRFLRLLLGPSFPTGDDVAAAFLLQASATCDDSRGFLVHAGKALAAELSTELPRLNALLRRISQ